MTIRPAPEQCLGDRYVLREQVGRGGFGIVWRAHDNLLQRDVAVKAIEFPAILDDAEQAVLRTKCSARPGRRRVSTTPASSRCST